MSINKYYIIICSDKERTRGDLVTDLPDSDDDAMNISGVMNLNMHYSFSNIVM